MHLKERRHLKTYQDKLASLKKKPGEVSIAIVK